MKTPKLKLTILAILLSLVIFSACTTEQQTQPTQPTTPTYPEASMTPDQVVNLVLVYGVPNLIPKAQPVGQWAAVYEGAGRWRIQGSVATPTVTGGTRYWKTTWSYANNKVTLIKGE